MMERCVDGLDEGIEPFGESKRDSQSSRTSAMKPDDILKLIAKMFFAAFHTGVVETQYTETRCAFKTGKKNCASLDLGNFLNLSENTEFPVLRVAVCPDTFEPAC